MFNKILVIFCVIIALAATVPQYKENESRARIKETCEKEVGVSEETAAKNYEKNINKKDALCFSKCVMEQMGLLKDGVFDKEKLSKSPFMHDKSAKKTNEQVVECVEAAGKIETCEDIMKFHNCLNE